MPFLAGHPPGRLRRKPQHRFFSVLPREDAITRPQNLLKLQLSDILRFWLLNTLCSLNRIDRKASKPFPEVTPTVEIPVVTVMREALRRDRTARHLAGPAIEMLQFKPLTTQQCVRDHTEYLTICLTGSHMQHPDPTGHLFGRVITRIKQPPNATSQRLDVRFQ